jgi:hypothetical protein
LAETAQSTAVSESAPIELPIPLESLEQLAAQES